MSPFKLFLLPHPLFTHTETHTSCMHTQVLAPFPGLCVVCMKCVGSIFRPHYLFLLHYSLFFLFFMYLCSFCLLYSLCEQCAFRKCYINKLNVTTDCLGYRIILFLCEPLTELSKASEQHGCGSSY